MSSAPPALSTEPAPSERQGARTPMILLIACAAQFMVVLDVSIVNVALPDMKASLGLSPAGQQWIVNAYTLAFAGLLLLGGRAADLVGARRTFLAGLVLFAAASLACGLSGDGTTLIAARAVQGLGGALLAPATLTLIMTTFTEPRSRMRAMGTWSSVNGGGGAAGAVVGGLLTEYAGWRWVFFVNIPIGLAILAAALLYVPAVRGSHGGLRRLDLPGALSVTVGLTALVYGIISTESSPWGSPHVWGALSLGILFLAAFVLIESKVAAPLVPLAVLRRRTLAIANLVMIGLGSAMFAMWFLLSLYMQQVLGFSAVKTGLLFLPGCVAVIVGTRTSAHLVRRIGPRSLLVTGMAVSTFGFLWLSRIAVGGVFTTDVAPPFGLCALGLGMAMLPVTAAATTGIQPREAGLASGLVNTSRQVGGALGLAILAAVASHGVAEHLVPGVQALTAGYGRAFLFAALFTACAAFGSFFLPGRPATAGPGATAPGPGAGLTSGGAA
ncbi:MFS transporter [Streptomyces sp. NBC_01264]|uniref:MFS transporter n=1 Tax=Streptomyces sp. NBC_01264 TaxID=2903804 RepID=UPI002255FAB7|nr:MFS transporter [Streptomyces sp. NBC_01264]MCX4776096.1 MFS transporter [Streptomyces sp. NBC_01264]